MKTIFFACLTLVFSAFGLWYTLNSRFDFGDFVVWCIALACFLYTAFHRQIDLFASAGFGFFCKMLFYVGCAIVVILLGMILWGQFGEKAQGSEPIMIVLGCAVQGEEPSAILTYRLDAAYQYYLEHPEVTIVVSGGQGVLEEQPEAVVMQHYLLQKGVPTAQLLVEQKSTSTEENFRFSKILLEENGFKISEETAVLYVTNGFHCMRAGKYAQGEGFANATAIAAGLPISQILTCYLREIFAVAYYFVFKSPNTGFLKNYVGLLAIFGKH